MPHVLGCKHACPPSNPAVSALSSPLISRTKKSFNTRTLCTTGKELRHPKLFPRAFGLRSVWYYAPATYVVKETVLLWKEWATRRPEGNVNLLDPNTFHRLVSRKPAYLLLNAAAIVVLLWYGQLRRDFDSILSCGIALALLNLGAYASARKYKDWK